MVSRRPGWPASRLPFSHGWRPSPDSTFTARVVLVAVVLSAFGIIWLNARPQPHWLLWIGAGLTMLASDGIVRLNPRSMGASMLAVLTYAVLPASSFIGAGFVFDAWADGFLRIPAGIVVGLIPTAVILGEYHSVHPESRWYGRSRLFLAAAMYAVAFGLLFTINDAGMAYPWRALLAGVVTFVLSAALLRESHVVSVSTTLSALAIAITLGELQLALYFFPLEEMSRAVLLSVGFYVATGSLHHLLENDVDLYIALEYGLVAAGGITGVLLVQSLA